MPKPQHLYVSSQTSQRQVVALPLPTPAPLTKVFPWLATAGSAPRSLDDEFAMFADEASEWASATLTAVLESWPDDDWSAE